MASKLAELFNHPAGPKTIFFWAPAMKWGVSFANIRDFQRPPELISLNQQAALAISSVIWCRYSMVIIPKNYNLLAVNTLMATTAIYQLQRKFREEKPMDIYNLLSGRHTADTKGDVAVEAAMETTI